MAVFIEVVTDAFTETFNAKAKIGESRHRAGLERVRRPLRGLEIKEDTHAIIKMIRPDGTSVPLFDQSRKEGTNINTSSFILQSVNEARMEKHQIVETFGESYIFFFGEAPRFLDVTAILINSNDFNWKAEWWENYQNFMRGTKSVEIGARTYLFYDDNIVEGYMLQAQSSDTSDNPMLVQLSFRLFITNYRNISFVGNPNFPTPANVSFPVSLTEPLNGEELDLLVESGAGRNGSGKPQGGFYLEGQGPLRGLIEDNTDEFTKAIPESEADPLNVLYQQIVNDLQESANVLQQSVDQLEAVGGDVNNPNFMKAMGFGPNFRQAQGVGIGAGSGYSEAATFRASAAPSSFTSFTSSSTFSSSSISSSKTVQSLTVSPAGASFGGGSGAGAATAVTGNPTAFAFESFEGTLDSTGLQTTYQSAAVGG